MLRLRVTDLDAWLAFSEPTADHFELSTEEFLAHMRRELPETEPMLAGRAFHEMLERASAGEEMDDLAGVQVGGFQFYCGGDLEVAVPSVREEEVERIYRTPTGPVLLRGRLDGREGLEATDYKLTFSSFDAERYAASLQWRAYLDMTGARRFRYLVFTGKLDAGRVWLYEAHELDFWSYPEMGEDVRRRVAGLAAFVRTHLPELESTVLAAAAR